MDASASPRKPSDSTFSRSRQRPRQVGLRDADAIVGNAQQLDAALFKPDLDCTGARIERVFEQFLEHRGGAFDHLAGGDLVDQGVG
jgi:hypothetical protein